MELEAHILPKQRSFGYYSITEYELLTPTTRLSGRKSASTFLVSPNFSPGSRNDYAGPTNIIVLYFYTNIPGFVVFVCFSLKIVFFQNVFFIDEPSFY